MKKVEELEQYRLKEHRYIEDIRSDSFLLEHKKTGARIALLSNDDENKVFYIGFRTPPKDSTGVAHIIEHTVLCGSERYPIKDPFLELAKGSLNTFLNAMTYPDKTIYPVADMNDADFRNLMDVYLDAVFNPNIYKNRNIFRQEGWHYECEDIDSPLSINGVVYNEMKGAFSSPDDVLERMIMNSLYPDNAYGTESGGDPDCIPDLTYEAYLDFHRKYYHPSNSYIYLYGDMDMAERLEYLDREYLSHYDRIVVDSLPSPQKPFDSPRKINAVYPVNREEQTEHRSFLSYNAVLPSGLSRKEYAAWSILDYALCSSAGAPVRKALIDAGIGSEVTSEFEGGIMEPFYSIAARDTDPGQEPEFTRIIEEVIKGETEKGFDRKALTAAINLDEFKYREADFGRYPKGLMYGLKALDSWLYNDDAPFEYIEALDVFRELREEIETGYFEKLAEKWLLNNRHKSILVLSPEAGLIEEKDLELKNRLEEYRSSLSVEERQRIVDETKALKAWQETPDSPEDMLKLPVLSRSDLKREIRPYKNDVRKDGDTEVLYHPIWTNGIAYLKYVFDITDIPDESLKYVNLVGMLLGALDTEHHGYGELSNDINIRTGGIYEDAVMVPVYHGREDESRTFFRVSASVLSQKAMDAAELVAEIISETKWDSKKRIKELISENRARLQAEYMQAGHSAAVSCALSQLIPSRKRASEISGLPIYEFLVDLEEHFDERAEDLVSALKDISSRIFCPGRFSFDLAVDESEYDAVIPVCGVVRDVLYEDRAREENEPSLPEHRSLAYKLPSTVQYVCRAGLDTGADFEYDGALDVLRVIMSYDYLWANIRVLGGAYGCMCDFGRTGHVSFVSYRDPNLKETLEVYEKAADYIENFEADERTMTKYVIGAVAVLDRPFTPAAYADYSRSGYLTGRTEEEVLKNRLQVLDAKPEDIRKLSGHIRKAFENSVVCVFGSDAKIEENRGLFDSAEYIFKN